MYIYNVYVLYICIIYIMYIYNVYIKPMLYWEMYITLRMRLHQSFAPLELIDLPCARTPLEYIS